jgi:hypothetical protein
MVLGRALPGDERSSLMGRPATRSHNKGCSVNTRYVYIVKMDAISSELRIEKSKVKSCTDKSVTLFDRDHAFGYAIRLRTGVDDFYWSEGEAVHGFIYKASLKIEKLQEEIDRLKDLESDALLLLDG